MEKIKRQRSPKKLQCYIRLIYLKKIANFYETLHKYLDFKLQDLPSPAYFCNIPKLEIYTAPALVNIEKGGGVPF